MDIKQNPGLQLMQPAGKPAMQQVDPAQMQLQAQEPATPRIGAEQLQEFTKILQEYKSGKTYTELRIVASENWWKLRNSIEEQKDSEAAAEEGFKSVSGWLHNEIGRAHV